MSQRLMPEAFLFRYAFPIPYLGGLPERGSRQLGLSAGEVLPAPAVLNGEKPSFELRMAWNDDGIGVRLALSGRKRAPRCDPDELDMSEGLRLWIDTRNTQNIHRASRFCHQFQFCPTGGGPSRTAPFGRPRSVPRAREDAPHCRPEVLQVSAEVNKTGYTLEAWIPARALNGFDPEGSPQLGFYYEVADFELGPQALTVGRQFPFDGDPSLWQTLDLVRDSGAPRKPARGQRR